MSAVPPYGDSAQFACHALRVGDGHMVRVQEHRTPHGDYLLADCILTDPPLRERCARLSRAPMLLLHGRADRLCPPEGALAGQQCATQAELRMIDGARHDTARPAMATAMVEGTDAFTAHDVFRQAP